MIVYGSQLKVRKGSIMRKVKSPLPWIAFFFVLLIGFVFGFRPPKPPFDFKTISSGTIISINKREIGAIPLEEKDVEIIKQLLIKGNPKTVKAQLWETVAELKVYPGTDYIIKIRLGQYNTSLDVMKNYDVVYDAIIDNEDRKVIESLIKRYTVER